MRRRYFIWLLFGFLLQTVRLSGQDISVQAVLPEGALLQKGQLWNLVITNTASSAQNRQLSMTLVDKTTNRRVLSAITNVFSVSPGARLYQLADLMPVMYNSLSPEFSGTDFDFLPAGEYQVCYELIGNKGYRSGVSCVPISVQLINGPQLEIPVNKARVQADSLYLSWMPVTPEPLLSNATYKLRVVRLQKGQDAATAMKENPAFYDVEQLSSLNYIYPSSAPRLEVGQHYAWQVTAYNGSQKAFSETWRFEVGKDAAPSTDGQIFTKLEKAGLATGYSLVSRYLRFSFLNESTDSVFQVLLTDVSNGKKQSIVVDSTVVPLFIRGVNQVQIDLSVLDGMQRKHLYELRVIDRRRQSWNMMFKYQ